MPKREGTIHQEGRRDFIKAATMAGLTAAIPPAVIGRQDAIRSAARGKTGTLQKLLCVFDNPAPHEKFIEAVRAMQGSHLEVHVVAADYGKPDEFLRSIASKDADVLLLCLPRLTFSFGKLYDSLGDMAVPIVVLTQNPELIPIDANFVASIRANGAEVLFATSERQALDLLRALVSPRILEGKRAIVFGRPFDSTSVPAHNLTEDRVYERTGVRIQYRPMEELIEAFKHVKEEAARQEADRWKKEAVRVMEPSDRTILDACRLYVHLRSLVEKDGFDAVSIDCLGLLFNPNPILPYPCLAFARLRDEGITAACEADVCGLISSMFLEKISRKPTFFANVLSVDLDRSSILFSHCVSPLKLMGAEAAPLPYNLRDYHGMGRGVVPEVRLPLGVDMIAGSFSKDLKSFILWPGKTQAPELSRSAAAMPSTFRRMECANNVQLRIDDAAGFMQNIPGIHCVLAAFGYSRAIRDALLAMNMRIIGPSAL